MFRRTALVLFLLALPGAAWCKQPASSQVEVLSLEDALSQAMLNNRQVKNAYLEAQKADDALAAARTRYLPKFMFDAVGSDNLTPESYTFTKGSLGTLGPYGNIALPFEDTTIKAKAGITGLLTTSVEQPIFQLYRTHLTVRERELASELAREQLRLQRHSVTDDVKRAYYGILQSKSMLQATGESIKYHRELDLLMDRYLKEMKVLKTESLDAKAQLAKAEHEALTLRNTLSTQREQLNDLLGRDLRTRFEVKDVPEFTLAETDLETAQNRALEQRPEVREAKIKVKQAEYNKLIKKSEYIPDLSLGFSYLSAPNVEFLPNDVAAVGLYFRWEFFDWGRKQKELAEKSKAIQQANNSVEEAESKVVIDLNNQYRKMEEASSLRKADEIAREAAGEKLRVLLDKYAVDASLLSEVLRAQTALADANSQYHKALLSYWTARAGFKKAIGED